MQFERPAGILEMEWLILTGLLQKQIEQPG